MSNNGTIFKLTVVDVADCITELHLGDPKKIMTDDFLHYVTKGVQAGLGCWDEVLKVAITEALALQDQQPELPMMTHEMY